MKNAHLKRFLCLLVGAGVFVFIWSSVVVSHSRSSILPRTEFMLGYRCPVGQGSPVDDPNSVSLQQLQALNYKATHDLYENKHPPSNERETARRRVETTATELWYLLDDGVNRLRKVISDDADGMKVLDRFNETLDEYHTAMHRALQSLRQVDDNERWRESESKRLGDLVQRRLDYIQNPADCSKRKQFVCDLTQICGFGCKLHHAVFCLQFAYATNRTFILDDRNMHYKSEKGWNTYFRPISSCNESTETPVDWNLRLNHPGTLQQLWPNYSGTSLERPSFQPSPVIQDHHSVEDFYAVLNSAPVVLLPPLYKLDLRPDFLPLAIPADLAPRLTAFHGDPAVWWLGQFLKYVMRPNEELAKIMNEAGHKFGFQRPIVGLHVRRTDKIDPKQGEAPVIHSFEEYMGHVEDYFRRNHEPETKRRVYLATDDPDILIEAQQKFPNYLFISDNEISRQASVESRYEEGSMRGIIMDILFLSMTDFLVCTFSSNIGRAAYELMQTRSGDAADRYRSLDDVYFFHSQNSHDLVALLSHTARNETEISIKAGDRLKSRGNYWESGRGHSSGVNFRGFTDVYNYRTGKSGMVPSHKVRDQIVTVQMAAYPELQEERDVSKIVNNFGLDFWEQNSESGTSER